MERSKRRGKSKCFILGWKFSVVGFQLSDVSLTRRRKGLAEGFLVFSCQFSVVSHTRRAGICWFLLIWGLISLTRRRGGLAEEYWNSGV